MIKIIKFLKFIKKVKNTEMKANFNEIFDEKMMKNDDFYFTIEFFDFLVYF